MSAKKYIVRLSEEEREELESIVNKGNVSAYKRRHAHILLKADIGAGGTGYKDEEISKALDVSAVTVERVRKRLVEEGLESALTRKEQKNRKAKRLDGEQEAKLIALARSEAPEGHARWSLKLLAGQMVELGYVETVSHETVRQVLKKRTETLGP